MTDRSKSQRNNHREFPVVDIHVPGVRLSAIYRPGPGPLVLLIHGNSSCKEVFRKQFRSLTRQGYGILAPDLPGHGQSSNARDPKRVYSFPGYAAALKGLLDCLNIKSAHAVGWSLGGHVGLELLATDKRIRSLLITGTPPVDPGPAALSEAFLRSPAMGLAGKRKFVGVDAVTYASYGLGGRKLLTPVLLKAARRTHGEARYWMLKNGISGVGINEKKLVTDSKKPLAIVQGDQDAFVNLRYIQELKCRNLWRGKVQVLRRTGHAPQWQRPQLFNRLLIAFLGKVA